MANNPVMAAIWVPVKELPSENEIVLKVSSDPQKNETEFRAENDTFSVPLPVTLRYLPVV